jgi:hypothetical protein
MKTNNDRILASALKAWGGQLEVENSSGGWCLRVVRQIVQDALDIGHEEFYRRYMTHKAPGTARDIPYARDVQYSLRVQGLRVENPEPGDIGCSWRPMPYGHIWVYITPTIILENLDGDRPFAKRGYLGLTHISDFKNPIEVFRLRE